MIQDPLFKQASLGPLSRDQDQDLVVFINLQACLQDGHPPFGQYFKGCQPHFGTTILRKMARRLSCIEPKRLEAGCNHKEGGDAKARAVHISSTDLCAAKGKTLSSTRGLPGRYDTALTKHLHGGFGRRSDGLPVGTKHPPQQNRRLKSRRKSLSGLRASD